MRQSFQADKAKGVHARYQWELSGPNGGEWWIDVSDGDVQDGARQDRQSQRDIYYQRQ